MDGIDIVEAAIADALARIAKRPLVVGICGSQGSGKTTMCAGLRARFEAKGMRTAVLALDDLYLSKARREQLAATVHPLLRTRGVPGTHDIPFGERLLDNLGNAGEIRIPRFDKLRDDLVAPEGWPRLEGPFDLVLFEGWCIGARPEPDNALDAPVNDLERTEDGDGTWRRFVNAQLAGEYARLFGRIGFLVLLAAPAFETVFQWRRQQEDDLARELKNNPRPGARVMSDSDLERFISHYERLTRWILSEMPARAALTVRLDQARRPV